MRRALLALVAFTWLSGCKTEVITRPATQVTLRIDLSPILQAQARSLRVRVATQNGKVWTESGTRTVTLKGLALPVDLPVIPGSDAPRDQTFEAVIDALGAKAKVLAQARVITQFVPREQRVLEVSFGPCGTQPLGDLCESQPNCHGSSCKTCVVDSCGDTPVIDGSDLDPLKPDQTPEPTEWTKDPIKEPDAGASADGGVCTETKRCNDKTVEQCKGGTWSTGKTCEFLCENGECVGECTPDERRCDGLMSQLCDDESTWQDEKRCVDLCESGSCIAVPSCKGALKCGDNESCCVSEIVPGGSFSRSYDGSADFGDDSYRATVSPFRLDRFEVTVGRFRNWLNVYDMPGSKPKVGGGKNVNNADDPGWQAEWTKLLPKDAEALEARFATCEGLDPPTWSGDVAKNDLPINCIDWYTALAFCIWDGGRLPTEAEWNYAAAGGDEQRVFPWSDPPSSDEIQNRHAVFSPAPIDAVGSRPDGDSRWGQADLAGNLYEWAYDWYQDPYPVTSCNDCSNLASAEGRVRRGGTALSASLPLKVSWRADLPPDVVFSDSGIRCARLTQ